jgi:hypothetical protein
MPMLKQEAQAVEAAARGRRKSLYIVMLRLCCALDGRECLWVYGFRLLIKAGCAIG